MDTATQIDREVINLVKQAYDKATAILREHMQQLNTISRWLLEKETMTGEEFMELLNQQPKVLPAGTNNSASDTTAQETK